MDLSKLKWSGTKSFDSFVKLELKFTQCKSDKCLYVLRDGNTIIMYLLSYVDDILLVGNNQNVMDAIKLKLKKRFEMKDLGCVNHFLARPLLL